ncbi:MAG TPA: hypothetical protein VKT51_01835 [Candidatus Eremiobacteraceae bacterium]|nr:hypothetical protein [Candidatus Eremiobacteraceae bacterium]
MKTSLCVRAAIIAAALLSLSSLAAGRVRAADLGVVNPALFAGMHWRLIGPFRGGRDVAVAGVPGDPTTAYFGAVGGGVWKTTDAGRTWNPIFDSQGIASVGAIAIAPSNPAVIYVGSGEADMRSDITYGDGMYKSTDAGATWHHIGLDETRQIARIIVDPKNPDVALVAALGHAYAPNEERGVYRTNDGGATWQRVLFKDANTGAIDLASDPQNPQTIFASLWQTRRPPWNIYPPSNGPGSGLYVSHDGGSNWSQIHGGGFPSAGLGKIGIAVAPSEPNRVYAIVDAKAGGLYRSDDSGVTWKLVDADQRLWQRGWYFCHITVDPKDADRVYISDTAFYRSTDGGAHFTAIKGSPDGDDFHQPWVDPDDPRHIVLGSDQGTSISLNGGATWSSWFNQPTGQFYHVIADDQFPTNVYGAQQDNGAAVTPVESDDNGITTFDWQPIVAGGESGSLAPDPLHPGVIFGDNVTREDLTRHQVRPLDPTITYLQLFRQTWTLPLVFSKTDPRVLYYGRQVVFRSADGGDTWRIISPDLTRADPGVPVTLDASAAANNQGIGPRRGVVYTIAPSPIRGREIWAGTDDGKIWLTMDEGAHWRDVTPPALTGWSKVGIIEASAFDPMTAYAAVDRHRLDDLRPYIYRTRDGGKSWTLIAGGIPVGAYVNAVREDPDRLHLLYAGTELGVYVSFDDGGAWQPLQLNLPVTPVRDLAIKRDALIVATHGRSFWVLDDLAPLHELTPALASGFAHLFAPETAVRLQPHAFPSERLPPEEPSGENRPVGAYIDYFIGSAAAGNRVTIEIRDATGGLVRRYSSDEPAVPTNPDDYDFPSFWVTSVSPPANTFGMHRYLWDFDYAAPALLSQPPLGPGGQDGVTAAPGTFSIKLFVGSQSYSATLRVVADPRAHVSRSDLAAQFSLARSIESLRVQVAETSSRARAIRAKMPLSDRRLSIMNTLLGSTPSGSPDDSVGSPSEDFSSLRFLARSLEQLQGLVESGDAAPTKDEVSAFNMRRDRLAAIRLALQRM